MEVFGNCSKLRRSDNKHVIFKKLEKSGEPYTVYNGVSLQPYRIFEELYINQEVNENYIVQEYGNKNLIAIEIKQNKENMEEKKQKLDDLVGLYTSAKITYKEFDEKLKTLYADKEECKSSLKEFDLEAAKAGKPVCTRDGRKARIICFDKQNDYYPIIALVTVDEKECIFQYTNKGEYLDGNDNTRCNNLIILLEKKEGWVNVYKGSGCISVYPRIYKSRDEAVSDNTAANRIDTVKITWEE